MSSTVYLIFHIRVVTSTVYLIFHIRVVTSSVYAGLGIRVVLWPQSTRTSGGPPESAMWWSGGVLETFNH